MKKIKWAMVGTGLMADLIVPDLLTTENTELVAFVSRSPEKIKAKMAAWGIDLPILATVEDAIADSSVDLIYIATPHSEHFPAAKKVIEAGKHCLVEKAFTMNQAEAIELAELARSKKVFLMEAMWSKFNPLLNEVKTRIEAGQIGDVVVIETHFGFNQPFDNSRRLFNKELGGGTTLDQGVYTISVATWLAGSEVTNIRVEGDLLENGADGTVLATLTYKNGAVAHASSSVHASLGTNARIMGTLGYIEIDEPFWSAQSATHVTLRRHDQDVEKINIPAEGNGYTPMVRAVSKAVLEGRTENHERTLDETIYIMGLLDQVRAQVHSQHE